MLFEDINFLIFFFVHNSVLPCSALNGFDEFNSEQELDETDEEAAEVEGEREGAHRQRHLVQHQ